MNKIPRNHPQHPLAGTMPIQPVDPQKRSEVHAANVARLKNIRVMSAKKAEALAQAFDQLQVANIDLENKATTLLHQNIQMHQILSVARNIVAAAEKVVESRHLTPEAMAELAGHLRHMPPMAVVDTMLRIYDNA